MYSTCMFCHKSLGANETFETFPVGERLAFDAAKGRLWVVCPHCERWMLSPLEERWETVEEAERLYRATRTRVATENIGLAKLRDGTTIVRIGEPLRPEFAAWRYGDQFGRRRKRQTVLAGAGLTAVGAVVAGGIAVGAGIGAFTWIISGVASRIMNGSPELVVARLQTASHGVVRVRRGHLAETSIDRASDGSLALELRFANGGQRFEGREAERIAAILISKVNRFGASAKEVARAVDEIEDNAGPAAYLDSLTRTTHAWTRPKPEVNPKVGDWRWSATGSVLTGGLFGLPPAHRLALEMALHEEAERRAVEGELEALADAWREAEEVAAISDSLLVAPDVHEASVRLEREAR